MFVEAIKVKISDGIQGESTGLLVDLLQTVPEERDAACVDPRIAQSIDCGP